MPAATYKRRPESPIMWTMRNLFAYSILFSLIALTGSLAQEKKAPTPPSKLVFEAKNGKVTFDHTAHAKREKNDCKMCHPVPFVQDAKARSIIKAGCTKLRRRSTLPAASA